MDVRELDLSKRELKDTDIEPIRELTQLETLDISDNGLTSLDAIASLPLLRSLDVSCNKIEALEPLRRHATLETLNLNGNPIADLSPLKDAHALAALDISSIAGINLSALPDCAVLRELRLGGAEDVGALEPLSRCGKLERVWANNVRDIAWVGELPNLRTLDLVGSKGIKDFSPLAHAVRLTSLHLQNTSISDVTVLRNLTELETLVLSYSEGVTDIAPLANLPKLRVLWVNGTFVSDISPLTSVHTLEELTTFVTPVKDLRPLAEMQSLNRLEVCYQGPDGGGGEKLDFTPITKLTGLAYLRINHYQLTTEQKQMLREALPQCEIEIQ